MQDALEQLRWGPGHPPGHCWSGFFPQVMDFDDQSCHFGPLLLNDAAYSSEREVFLLLFSIPDEH